MIRVLYFARLREELGTDGEELAADGGVLTVADITRQLCARGSPWQEALDARRAVKAAVNREMARPETPVHDGDEVAFFPPVTGG
jgi:molybdopterin synthase sulfur carrier subunit